VYAGILKTGDIEKYLLHAEESECKGVVVELGVWSEVELQIILTSCRKKGLEVIFYNTESKLIKDVPYILSLAEHKEVVGFKDSSMDAEFIKALKGAIPENVRFEVFQGMEMAITPEEDVDGYFISLANVEPELCVQLRDDRDNFDWTKLKEVIQAHNLESEKWYIYIKQALCQRGIIRTTDLVS
jgi:dihydrodipicolinate synthase/N-acetylneuraminate lyase